MKIEPTPTITVSNTEGHPSCTRDVLGPYVETAWLPEVGPTALLLARRFAHVCGVDQLRVVVLDPAHLARQLGVGEARLWAALARLERKGLVRVRADATSTHVTMPLLWPNAPEHARHLTAVPS